MVRERLDGEVSTAEFVHGREHPTPTRRARTQRDQPLCPSFIMTTRERPKPIATSSYGRRQVTEIVDEPASSRPPVSEGHAQNDTPIDPSGQRHIGTSVCAVATGTANMDAWQRVCCGWWS
jgi:hypothetical protein